MSLATNYIFNCWFFPDKRLVRVTMREVSTGKTKVFRLYGKTSKEQFDRIMEHMYSLTDDLCSQWFREQLSPEERKNRQKAAKAKAKEEQAKAANGAA